MIRSGKEHQESQERMVSPGMLFIALDFSRCGFSLCFFHVVSGVFGCFVVFFVLGFVEQ